MAAAASKAAGGDEGFALVAALMAMLLFALFAYTVFAADRGAVADLQALSDRARTEAAADAAVATVVATLGQAGPRDALPNGRVQRLTINDLDVTAVVEDERGKVPLNNLTPDRARRLLQAAGVSGRRLDILTDNLLDWEDGAERPNGAKVVDYAADGVRERGGPIRTVDELAAIRGLDSDLVERLSPALTLFPDPLGTFDPAAASALARAVMTSPGDAAPKSPAFAGSALAGGGLNPYVGHPLTIRIQVRDGDRAAFQRVVIVELTGQPSHPVWTRAVE